MSLLLEVIWSKFELSKYELQLTRSQNPVCGERSKVMMRGHMIRPLTWSHDVRRVGLSALVGIVRALRSNFPYSSNSKQQYTPAVGGCGEWVGVARGVAYQSLP